MLQLTKYYVYVVSSILGEFVNCYFREFDTGDIYLRTLMNINSVPYYRNTWRLVRGERMSEDVPRRSL